MVLTKGELAGLDWIGSLTFLGWKPGGCASLYLAWPRFKWAGGLFFGAFASDKRAWSGALSCRYLQLWSGLGLGFGIGDFGIGTASGVHKFNLLGFLWANGRPIPSNRLIL